MKRLARLVALGCGILMFHAVANEPKVRTYSSHALTLDYAPKYAADFKHVEYVNPNAPKGGTLKMFELGGYDSFNPYIIKGDASPGLIDTFYESLVRETEDDSLTGYGVIAHRIEVAEDLSFVIYHLREEAHFNDGSPITADDVVFSFHILKDEGLPFYRAYYANVSEAQAIGKHTVKFSFTGPPNRELPLIIGQIPVLSKAFWEDREFDSTVLIPPVTSGPYKIADFDAGRYIVFERDPNYWGAHLPLNVGFYNFDRIRYDFVRDDDVSIEAFKSGEYDYRIENSSKKWARSYNFRAVNDGIVKKVEMEHSRPTGMPAFVFNLRKPMFQDRIVRKALAMCFDFEWSNKNLFHGQYTRSRSFYDNSELAAHGLPSEAELAILNPYRGRIPDEVFTEVFEVPTTDGTGNIRGRLREASALLQEAGWIVKNNQLTHSDSGIRMEIEFLLANPDYERILSPYIQNLERLGVRGTIRTVEPAQFQNRFRSFDYDVVTAVFGQSRSPGNEQRDIWGSDAADRPGSQNIPGIKDPVIDELIENIVAAPSRNDLIVATRALDRVLQWNYLVIPTWHTKTDRVIWWDKFGIPEFKPPYGVGLMSWWVDPEKNKKVQAYRN